VAALRFALPSTKGWVLVDASFRGGVGGAAGAHDLAFECALVLAITRISAHSMNARVSRPWVVVRARRVDVVVSKGPTKKRAG
jgi:hypothetical protein